MTNKAPSEGQKVNLGQNAPNKTEGTGPVGSESLAAESYREGGEFSNNIGTQPENISSNLGATSTSTTTSAQSQQSANESQAGTAPSYVNNQYIKDSSGPHGKNLQEGFDDSGLKDGTRAAMDATLGSKDDPARAAELQFQYNQEAKSRAAGPKQDGLSNETKYDALNSETSS